MTSTKLAQLLESSRWAPYMLGALASLPVMAVMMPLWIYCEGVAILWLCLSPFGFGLDVFMRTPLRKMISMALVIGTYASFLIRIAP